MIGLTYLPNLQDLTCSGGSDNDCYEIWNTIGNTDLETKAQVLAMDNGGLLLQYWVRFWILAGPKSKLSIRNIDWMLKP